MSKLHRSFRMFFERPISPYKKHFDIYSFLINSLATFQYILLRVPSLIGLTYVVYKDVI